MSAAPLLAVRGLMKSFGGLVATDDLWLEVAPGEIHAVIGPNGAGKTTLVNLLSGFARPDGGTITFDGRDITRLAAAQRARLGLARAFQITSIFRDMTAADNVALAVQARETHAFRFWRAAATDPVLRGPAAAALAHVGLDARADVLAGTLAHGEQRALEIAMALATEPRLLLLDEPMAGMGPDESQRMVALLRGLKGHFTMLLVEHDMDAVFALADRITVLVYGRAIASGTPDEIRANAEVREAYLGEGEAEDVP
ncbi:MAG: ABC transporter ATP-binding protein [Alphaproteobacteria bacterium]|nr:ABC transporter ATP-binding protein [Alphaproteobacteria bacterium]